jgi:hypothetical protein
MDNVRENTNCGCGILLLIINLSIGAWSVSYLVTTFLHEHIAIGWALLIGLVGGQFTIPVAVIAWLLKLAGVL